MNRLAKKKEYKTLLGDIEGFEPKVPTWTVANCSEQCSALASKVQELEATGAKMTEYINQTKYFNCHQK